MKSQSIYRQRSNFTRSTCFKSADIVQEYFVAAIESQMCISICAFNEQSGEIYITQFIDCTAFRITQSTILRFAPKILISTQGNEKSIFFKQLEEELTDTMIYFLPPSVLTTKVDITKYSKNVLKIQQLQQCLNCLIYTVTQSVTVSPDKLPITFYNIAEVLVYNKQTIQNLCIFDELFKQFKPITNGGKRLLKANLLQPFNQIEQIELRQHHIKTTIQLNDSELSCIKLNLQKFKLIDSIACQMQVKSVKIEEQLQKIFKIYNFIKDLFNFQNLLKNIGMDTIMNISLYQIIQSEELQSIKALIEESLDTNLSQNTVDDELIYFLLFDQNNTIQEDRKILVDSKQQITTMHQKYLASFCVNLKCKKLKKVGNQIQCLRNGYVFEISQQEATRNNINEIDIKRIVEREQDQIQFIDKNNRKIIILTDQLAAINIKLDKAMNNILKQTQISVNMIFQQIIDQCHWIFLVNQFISQLDVILAFTEFCKDKNAIFPQFNKQQLVLKEGKYFNTKDQTQCLSVQFNRLNIVYNQQDQLSQQLKLLGQYIILSQIGCGLPCLMMTFIPVKLLFTHFQKNTIQNLAERQSSFTAEVTSLNHMLLSNQEDTLVLCDSLVVSSQHETNIAFNIAYLELISKKSIMGLFGTMEPDTMQVHELIGCNQMLSNQNSIIYIQQHELETIVDNEFNMDYKMNILAKLSQDIGFPQEFCMIMQSNFQKQQYANE